MHSTRSWLMVHAHTQPQLFVYAGIFSNRASEGYTAGGKHGVRRWSVGVLSLLFVYRSSPCALQAREINDGWRQFEEQSTSLIEKQPGFLLKKYHNIVIKPIFHKHCISVRQCQKWSVWGITKIASLEEIESCATSLTNVQFNFLQPQCCYESFPVLHSGFSL